MVQNKLVLMSFRVWSCNTLAEGCAMTCPTNNITPSSLKSQIEAARLKYVAHTNVNFNMLYIYISSFLASLPSQESRARIAAMQARLAKTKAAPVQEALTVPGRVVGNLFGNGLVLRCMVL